MLPNHQHGQGQDGDAGEQVGDAVALGVHVTIP